MNDTAEFLVRPLPLATVDGALRVHLSQDSLEKLQLDLTRGDVCTISDDRGLLGHGLAWRAADKMNSSTKVKVVKVTDIFKTILSIEDGSHVRIGKAASSVARAKTVVLKDVSESQVADSVWDEMDGWSIRCLFQLLKLEAIVKSMILEVIAKKNVTRRFKIIDIKSDDPQIPPNFLYRVIDSTNIMFADEVEDVRHDEREICINSEGICGLEQQIADLNRRFKCLTAPALSETSLLVHTQHILLHGFEGTGKSMILNRVESCNPGKTCRIALEQLAVGTPTKNKEIIQGIFKRAIACQPSVVVMDDLDELLSPDDKNTSRVMRSELLRLAQARSRVLVIGAIRNTADLTDKLVGPDLFDAFVELFIPNTKSREVILRTLQNGQESVENNISQAIANKTHGFTGKDLTRLHRSACISALTRLNNSSRSHTSSMSIKIDSETDSEMRERVNIPTQSPFVAEDFEEALTKVRPTALREMVLETPKVKWSDIGGSESISEILDEVIGWSLHHTELLESYNYKAQKGILLYGPPGCSKTLTAQAVASSYGLNFISIKGAELISMYVGESERAVRDVFRKARQVAPCVLFFDEIDSIGAERDGSGAKGLNVLTTLLTEMDGFEEMKGVLVLAATNKPEILDPALLRPGRFDSHIYVAPPNPEARRAIFGIGLKSIPVQENIDYVGLVSDTEGYSGAEVMHICRLAVHQALRRHLRNGDEAKVTEIDLRYGISQTIRGITSDMIDAYRAFAERKAA